MYNADFLPQLEEFRGYLWGAGCVDTRAASEEASKRPYFPPANVKILKCYEDINGERIPNPALGGLEKEIGSE